MFSSSEKNSENRLQFDNIIADYNQKSYEATYFSLTQ